MRFTEDGDIVAPDLARMLSYRDAAAMTRILDEDEKGYTDVSTPGGIQHVTTVNESGFYKLTLKREAGAIKDRDAQAKVKRFQRWVTHEVLPSIRKHGAYMTDEVIERTLTDPDYLIRLATQLKEQKAVIEEQKATLTEQAPKVLFADAITVSEDCVLVGQLAKVLKQNGVEIGQNRLYQWLRDNHYLSSRRGDDWNTPTQKAVDMGLFRTKPRVFIDSVGNEFVKHTTVVTGKGQEYLINKFLGDRQEVAA